ncbi:hypothetical protein O1611_g1576 [Lasiodiplodia mahajangana]|uniref:Uncharacterized protein n=1 Tax=Lasiodiplodia mahajangana TaxID=1108764 RepID=A0ACC2JXK4_9PEZI|nr:hypothetical protein O1611_g1576 [Lasiodiplodia mahajangana]
MLVKLVAQKARSVFAAVVLARIDGEKLDNLMNKVGDLGYTVETLPIKMVVLMLPQRSWNYRRSNDLTIANEDC